MSKYVQMDLNGTIVDPYLPMSQKRLAAPPGVSPPTRALQRRGYRPRLLQRLGHDARPRPDLQDPTRGRWMDGWMVCAYDLCIYKYIMWWIEFMNELYLLNLCMELELRVYAWKVCVKYNTTSIWKLYVHIHIYTLYIYICTQFIVSTCIYM